MPDKLRGQDAAILRAARPANERERVRDIRFKSRNKNVYEVCTSNVLRSAQQPTDKGKNRCPLPPKRRLIINNHYR